MVLVCPSQKLAIKLTPDKLEAWNSVHKWKVNGNAILNKQKTLAALRAKD